MDTDVEVLKPLDSILHYQAVSGFESQTRIPTGLLACRRDYLWPKDLETKELHVTENTLCIHHFDGSWLPKSVKRKRKLQRLLGKRITSWCVLLKRLCSI